MVQILDHLRSWAGDNRRKFPRFLGRWPVNYTRLGAQPVHQAQTVTEDVSTSGIRLRAHEFIPTESRLKIEMTLGQPGPAVQALGEVIWVQEIARQDETYMLGVRFVHIPEESQGELERIALRGLGSAL